MRAIDGFVWVFARAYKGLLLAFMGFSWFQGAFWGHCDDGLNNQMRVSGGFIPEVYNANKGIWLRIVRNLVCGLQDLRD